MFRNYLVTALRNIVRHRLYSLINIAGLAVGLSCAVFIILFIRDEVSYDKWIPDSENLYRIEHTFAAPSQAPMPGSNVPYPVAVAMQQQIPEVTAITHLTGQRLTAMIGNRLFSDQFHVVDPNFFHFIKLPLAEGAAATVFSQADSVVLSQTRARKYFGDAEPLGKTIILSENRCDDLGENCQVKQYALKVTGVMRDVPHNSHLLIDALFPTTSNADPMPQKEKVAWFNSHGWAYARLAPGADPNVVVAKMKPIIDRSADPKLLSSVHLLASSLQHIRLVPFRELHLSTDRFGGMKPPGSWATIYGFAIIGILIQLVACFNFTNLATARATMRAREVSLRKVMGATRRQLVIQFLGESLLMSVFALFLALAVVEVLLPSFDQFLGRPIGFNYMTDWPVLAGTVVLALVSGFLGGAYPAFVLSGFRPAAILRANQAKQGGSGLLRTVLVVLQFAVSIGLGIAALVIFAQISFARHMDLGFHKDNVEIIRAGSMSPETRDTFERTLRNQSGVLAVTSSNYVPLDGNDSNWDVHVPGSAEHPVMRVAPVDQDFPRTFGVKLLAGRLLDRNRGSDAASAPFTPDYSGGTFNVLINESAMKEFGLTRGNVAGKHIFLHNTDVIVVGVLADFKWAGTVGPVVPTIYYNDVVSNVVISIRLRGSESADTLAVIDRLWRRFAPTVAIQRHLMSDDFDKQFLNDDRQGAIFGLFVGIAILIACLGLFGLAAFTAGRRTKEIGVRKVFGARTRDVIFLLLWQFSIPVLVANAIAWPLAWFYLHNWLEGYAYRIPLTPIYFLASGMAALLIAWVTVFAHAQRVASANPIHALRYE
ncbi:MAG TPA: ABC transporter permease [Rhizomicrobium sp.]|jgi:putative ABC transport system permease protein